jgi:hypothetical protein
LPVPEYPGHFLVKRVIDAGTFPLPAAIAVHRECARESVHRPGGD